MPQPAVAPGPERRVRGKPLNCTDLVDSLCEASVPLREARREHLAAYGKLIPHVFMGAVLARVGQCFVVGAQHAMNTNGTEMEGIFRALESGIARGDREARNVVAISFVRDAEVELFFDDLKPMLGPATRAQARG